MTSPSLKHLVWYADDDADDIALVREAFEKYDRPIDLQTFNDGMELLQYIRSGNVTTQPPCLIIIDLNMPRLNGKDTLRLLRNIDGFENTPVVLFTTSSMPADAYFARHYKAGFVTKPLAVHQMDLIIDSFIEHCTDDIKKKLRNV
jgi:CheY-like chemotaxis protein